MHQIMDEYGKSGKLAWVYRQFPIPNLHPKAPRESEAAECAGDQGGNDAFWKYLDRLFEITPANNGLDPAELPKIAAYIGLDQMKFEECLDTGKFTKKIENDFQAAVDAGAPGTPYSIIIDAKGGKTTVNGAEEYNMVKQKIDAALGVK